MLRQFVPVLICIALGLVLFLGGTRRLRAQAPDVPADEDRVANARNKVEIQLKQLLANSGLSYPPPRIFLRAFKAEQVLELWAGAHNEPLKLLREYPLTANSGGLGPKRKEGDKQIPEGCYVIERFNPKSLFHLSMGLNYPNASDLILSDREKPGKDIFIHGRAKSVGCLAIGDPSIEELYVLAQDCAAAGTAPINVHIFPGRMDRPNWVQTAARLTAENPTLGAFWEDLRPIYQAFERDKRVPEIQVDEDGRYRLKEATASAL